MRPPRKSWALVDVFSERVSDLVQRLVEDVGRGHVAPDTIAKMRLVREAQEELSNFINNDEECEQP